MTGSEWRAGFVRLLAVLGLVAAGLGCIVAGASLRGDGRDGLGLALMLLGGGLLVAAPVGAGAYRRRLDSRIQQDGLYIRGARR